MIKLHRRAKAPDLEEVEESPANLPVEVPPSKIGVHARIAAGGTVSSRAQLGGWGVLVGEAKIIDDARVLDHAVVTGRAVISGAATVSGWASVIDQAKISDEAWVFGRAVIAKQGSVSGRGQVFGDATVSRLGSVTDRAWIYGHATVTDIAAVRGQARVGGRATVCANAIVDGPLRIKGQAVIGYQAHVVDQRHFELHKLPWGDWVTLYRCVDGWVGAGFYAQRTGPLPRNTLPPDIAHLADRITELADQWRLDVAVLTSDSTEPRADR